MRPPLGEEGRGPAGFALDSGPGGWVAGSAKASERPSDAFAKFIGPDPQHHIPSGVSG